MSNAPIVPTPTDLRLVPPGGPQGPFWGLISGAGYVVALQIVDEQHARLFAAAPALLAALDGLIVCHPDGMCWCIARPVSKEHDWACQQASAAIARAKGASDGL